MQAYCNDNFKALNLLMPDEKDKEFRWKVVKEEFSYLMQNEDGDHFAEVFDKITVLESHIVYVQNACDYLLIKYDQDIADKLSLIYPADYTDKNNISLALVMCDTKIYDYEILNDEYKRLSDSNKGERQTYMEFNKEVRAVSKWLGGAGINKKTTTVTDYAGDYQNLLTESKRRN